MIQQYQKFTIIPAFIVLLISIALLISFNAVYTAERDPLHTDLTASVLYAKNGFQPSYAGIADPGDLDWDFTLPPQSGSVVFSDLPAPDTSVRYGRYSTAAREAEEFTIYIPFTLEKWKYDYLNSGRPSYPFLYFIGIGENWEIYLNGQSIAREIYTDESGSITKYRSLYKVSVPVEKSILREGGNDVVIHIIGARSSKWAGLRYVSPYYLGDNTHMANGLDDNAGLVLCAVFMFAGLYHLLIYALRKTDRYNLLYSGCTTVASAYYFFKMPIAHSIISNTIHLERLDYTLLYVFVFMFCAFVDSINYGKITRTTAAYAVISSVMAIAQWFFPIWFVYELLSVWQIITVVFLVYFLAFHILRRLFTGALQIKRNTAPPPGLWRAFFKYLGSTEFGNVSVLLLLIVVTALIDILNFSVFNVNVSLSQYSFLGVVLCMIYVLARKFPSPSEMTALYSALEHSEQSYQLTPKEKRIAHLLIDGATHRDVARKLRMTADELESHEKDIRKKLNLAAEADPDVAAVISEFNLTKREAEMLECLCDGMETSEIAAELSISEETVRVHVSNLMKKMNIEKRADVSAWFDRAGGGKTPPL